jgi:hypothetical protein
MIIDGKKDISNYYTLGVKQAIDQIYGDYGDRVIVKPKSLLKFGKNGEVTTSFEMVWDVGGFETMPSGNTINRISSSNDNDDQPVVIEGHTISDGNLTFVAQNATVNGQTEVTLDIPLYRATRIFNATTTGDGNGTGDFEGDVYVYESGGTVTDGVPQDSTKIHVVANSDGNQSNKCATSISSTDYWIVTSWDCGVRRSGSQARRVEFLFQMRSQTGVWRTKSRLVSTADSGTVQQELSPCIIVPKNYDVRVICVSSGADTEVESSINGYLAQIQ